MSTEKNKLKRLTLKIETCLKTSRSIMIQTEDAEYLLRLIKTVDAEKYIKVPEEPKCELNKPKHFEIVEPRDLRVRLFDAPGTVAEKIKCVLNDTNLSVFELSRIMKVDNLYLQDLLNNILLPKHQADIIRWKLGFSHKDIKPYIKPIDVK